MYGRCPTDLLHPTPYLHFKGFQSCDVLLSHSPYFCTVHGHTSNQCFHHSFLEAFSLFSILPLVIHFSWKRLLSHCYPGASILGAEGGDPHILGRGSCGGCREGRRWIVDGSRNIIISYHVHEVHVCSKVFTFEEKLNNLARGSCKWTFFAWKNKFFNCLKKSKFSKIFLQNSIFFCKIA